MLREASKLRYRRRTDCGAVQQMAERSTGSAHRRCPRPGKTGNIGRRISGSGRFFMRFDSLDENCDGCNRRQIQVRVVLADNAFIVVVRRCRGSGGVSTIFINRVRNPASMRMRAARLLVGSRR